MKACQFYIPTRIIAGAGVVGQVGAEAKWLGARRALVVTDDGVSGAGLTKPVVASISGAGIDAAVFDAVRPDPTVAVVAKGAALARTEQRDLLVAVGGGSSIDAAKGIAIMSANPGTVCDYEGVDKFKNAPLPIIAIPTTAGTGSEVTFGSVFTDEARNYKFIVYSRHIAPRVALLDPAMVASAPRMAKVAAGLDALTHAIESYTSLGATPYTEALALGALRMIGPSIRNATLDVDMDALGAMQIAANMAGMAFGQSRLGIVHAAALPLGAYFHVPHGISCAALLPYGLAFNLEACAGRYAEVARPLGVRVEGLSDEGAARALVDVIRKLAADLGVPARLRELHVKQELAPQMAADTMKSSHISANPRKITVDAVEALYREAI